MSKENQVFLFLNNAMTTCYTIKMFQRLKYKYTCHGNSEYGHLTCMEGSPYKILDEIRQELKTDTMFRRYTKRIQR